MESSKFIEKQLELIELEKYAEIQESKYYKDFYLKKKV